MSISKCVVRLKDAHDTQHSATVYAETLYEAVIRGLNLLQAVGWESDRDCQSRTLRTTHSHTSIVLRKNQRILTRPEKRTGREAFHSRPEISLKSAHYVLMILLDRISPRATVSF